MKILYLDCFGGISGDMFLGALIDLGLDLNDLKRELSKLKLKGYALKATRARRGGIAGTRFQVKLDRGADNFSSLQKILRLINESDLSLEIKKEASFIFRKLARTESKIHGARRVYFHELGSIDSLLDIIGACVALRLLDIKRIFSSKIYLGSGLIESAHGILPNPAPATLHMLEGMTVEFSDLTEELVTPTGASIINHFCQNQNLPAFKVLNIGYGLGRRELKDRPNILRAILGETESTVSFNHDKILTLQTNIDDMNPQGFESLFEKLFQAGAVDVYASPVQMKKSRPGFLLTVLLEAHILNKIVSIIFQETTTFGVRFQEAFREKLDSYQQVVKTRFGAVRIKVGKIGKKIFTASPEYEDCRRLSMEKSVPFRLIQEEAKLRWLRRQAS
jgi:hypothetical protein